MSRVEDDSDDDKVEYLDYDSGSTERLATKHGSDSRTPNRRDKPAVFQSLFQQKRYRGDLDKERSVDPADIAELMKAAKERDRSKVQEPFDDFANNSSTLQVSPIVSPKKPKGVISPYPVSRNARPSTVGEKDVASPQAHAVRASVPGAATQSASLDVADDRPAHWNRLRTIPARGVQKPSSASAAQRVVKSAPVVGKVPKPTPLPKPKALPAATAVTPVNASSIASGISFKPSWMTSTQPAGRQAQVRISGNSAVRNDNRSTPSHAIAAPPAEDVGMAEEIQEDYGSPVRTAASQSARNLELTSGGARSATQPGSHHRSGMSSAQGLTSPLHGPAQPTMLSPELSLHSYAYDFGVDSAEHPSAQGALHRTSSHPARSGAKARPGSLKAKLQKIIRESDAAENRIINVPVDRSSRAVDLQDPRHRAVCYVDAEVVQCLADRAPFKVARLEVVGSWSKASAISAVDGAGRGDESATMPGIETCESVLAYFKPETCVGVGRNLLAGLRVRIYDVAVLEGGEGLRSGDVPCKTFICTGCWEAVESE